MELVSEKKIKQVNGRDSSEGGGAAGKKPEAAQREQGEEIAA